MAAWPVTEIKAFSCGWCASMRASSMRVSSTLENSRGSQARGQLCQRYGMQTHSMTFGTRYSAAATCGALAW